MKRLNVLLLSIALLCGLFLSSSILHAGEQTDGADTDEPYQIEGVNPGFILEIGELSFHAPDGWRGEAVNLSTNGLFPQPDKEAVFYFDFSFVNSSTVNGRLIFGPISAEGKYSNPEQMVDEFANRIQRWYFADLEHLQKSKTQIAGLEADKIMFQFESPGWNDGTRIYKGWGFSFKTEQNIYLIGALTHYKNVDGMDYMLNWLLKGIALREKEQQAESVLNDRGIAVRTTEELTPITSGNVLANIWQRKDDGWNILCFQNPDFRGTMISPGDMNGFVEAEWEFFQGFGPQKGYTNFNRREIKFRKNDAQLFSCDRDASKSLTEINIWHNDMPYTIRFTCKKEEPLEIEQLEDIIKLRPAAYDFPIIKGSGPHIGGIIGFLTSGEGADILDQP